MQKAYVRQNFVNGTDPALDEVDMNKIDSGLSIVDDRVILLDGSKADKTQVFACVNSIIYTISTGILRITYVNGAVQDVNLGLQTTAMSMTENGIITMQDSEGNTYTCDLRNILNSKLSELTDVDVTGIEDGQGIAWDAANRKFVPVDLNPAPGQTVQIPVPKTKTYTYDGTEQTFEWDSIDTTNINVSGNTQTNAGSYTVTATLKSNRDEWSDGTKAAKTFAWTIAKAQSSFVLSESSVLIDSENPTATVNVTDIVGDGEVSAASSDNTIATASYSNGVVTITYVADGSVGVTVAIAETTNYLSASSIISVSNAPAIVQIPVAKSKTYTYNGSAQTFEWDSIDTTNINVSGDVKTNAGTYTVTASLKGAGDTWSDGTTADKTYSWTIGKAQGDFTLSANSASVTESNPTASINVSAITGDGALSVASSDTDVATASYSNGVITITGLDNGNAVITVSLGEGTNYLPVSKQISVAASGFPGSTVTVTLSIESAASDTVYVTGPGLDGTDYITTDSSGSGSGTLDIIPGETYTFTSSVAKALDGSGNDYSKNVTLTNSLSQSVDVYPDGFMFEWCGNRIVSAHYIPREADRSGLQVTVTNETNSTLYSQVAGENPFDMLIYYDAPIDTSAYTKLNIIAEGLIVAGNYGASASVATSSLTYNGNFLNVQESNTLAQIATGTQHFNERVSYSKDLYTLDLTSASDGLKGGLFCFSTMYTYNPAYARIYAAWLG